MCPFFFFFFFNPGTGKGGNSIWGSKFEDEFREALKVITPAVVVLRVWSKDILSQPSQFVLNE